MKATWITVDDVRQCSHCKTQEGSPHYSSCQTFGVPYPNLGAAVEKHRRIANRLAANGEKDPDADRAYGAAVLAAIRALNRPTGSYRPISMKSTAWTPESHRAKIAGELASAVARDRAKRTDAEIIAAYHAAMAEKMAAALAAETIAKAVPPVEAPISQPEPEAAPGLPVNAIAQARHFGDLIANGMSVKMIAETFRLKSQTIVRQRLKLLKLRPEIQTAVETGEISTIMGWGIATAPANKQPLILMNIRSGKYRDTEKVKWAGRSFRDAGRNESAELSA